MDTQQKITAICLADYHYEDLKNAFQTIEELFNACPGCNRQDLELLSEAYTNLKMILNKIEDEPGFEKVYKLY